MIKKNWHFYNPVRVVHGSVDNIIDLLVGNRILLVTSNGFVKRGFVNKLIDLLSDKKLYLWDKVTSNPIIDDLDAGIKELKNKKFDQIIALGGGSVIDTAKIFATMLVSNNKFTLDDVFRKNSAQKFNTSIPLLAVPSTSGSGSEVTPYATLWDMEKRKKYSMTGMNIYPDVALLDPSISLTLQRENTLVSALDSISHSLESIWNINKTPISEIYARSALEIIIKSLPFLLENLSSINLRSQMQTASMLAGIAISQTQTAIAHELSYPLTLSYKVPHGLASSYFLIDLISYYLQQKPDTNFKIIMTEVISLLQNLKLEERMNKYLNKKEMTLLFENITLSGRADNYELDIPDIKSIIDKK